MKYDYLKIEKKWQARWLVEKPYAAVNGDEREKFYALIEFPYPSGEGLHVGHLRPYTAMDIVARKHRAHGQNVLFPIGYDAFGLPTENYAIANKMHPKDVTERNTKRFTDQCQMMGYSFDWDRCIDTTDPNYYKWTQWIFLKMFEKGLAYKSEMPVNWCVSCKCVLANEEVVNGVCERCDSEVVRRDKSQWMLRITEYAQRLIDDLDDVDFIDRVKVQQRHWIGRSVGAEIEFGTTAGDSIRVFSTRPDTLFGSTYMVIAPEHELVEKWSGLLTNADEVREYRDLTSRKSDFERTELARDKTGVQLKGVNCINPATGDEMPIFISDYVLATYGTGAIMAVPGHDQRDWEFATAFGLPIIEVVKGGDITEGAFLDYEGVMVNSRFLDGLQVPEAIEIMTRWLEDGNIGCEKVNYRLRDWVFARQRYWGEPIPMIYCEHCGWVPVPESELPILLPEVESYEPSETGESPLADITEWVETSCPKCGMKARRETDTMPQWAGSSWYFLRYMDPFNNDSLVGEDAVNYWNQVDWYNGGMEHTTLHLLYSRFWHKFLYDIGAVPTSEPYAKRTSHGMILGEGGEKMSKSRGNAVNPNDIVGEYGADTLRLYIMFIGDFEKAAPWSPTAVKGCKRFLDRIWNLAEKPLTGDGVSKANELHVHRAIKKVGSDIENMKFNTAIAALMTLVNEFYDSAPSRGDIKNLLLLLQPFAPHITEELWELQGFGGSAAEQSWPKYDESKTVEALREIAVQVNGKLKTTVTVAAGSEDAVIIETACADEKIKRLMQGREIARSIVVKDKLVNLILRAIQ